ncbi:diacylglycerol/lipid kinase family protein [Pedobacter sp. SL55]|uniref:diacylglycerol/lipid kinase family protein n=1 Tax=Pedobacter sp. SL55 TaxID=2995161 RepID=UPI00226E80D2|nr:diacylglycerol kinase family protein [Pedobacter sp. SL55]WAC41607.1 diacylglycerol kinase family lipid kinase [Pedobacter sp. SL55]
MSVNKSNILFIINPISGGKKKSSLPALIDQYLDKQKFAPIYTFTEYVGHASELAEEAEKKNYDIIVAVGGDGTINEVASKLVHSDKILAIIPFGSGNGLARFLNIPLTAQKAISLINTGKHQVIDTAELNGKKFFNMAGMGFDAHLSSVFAGNKKRGLKSYVELGFKEITTYRAQPYRIEIDGVKYDKDAFAISIANSSQYGNNVYISPDSSLTDGYLDVCIIHPISLVKLPVLAFQMITAKTHKSSLVKIIRGKHIKIERNAPDAVHLDGEPLQLGENLEIKIVPASLKILSN